MTDSDPIQISSHTEAEKLKHNEYMRKWRLKNAAKNAAYNREYAKKNADKWKEYRKKDNERRKKDKARNPEKYLKYFREYRDKDRVSYRLRASKRRAALLQRIPPWADFKKIRLIYAECERLSKETGVEYQVDHVIPLLGKTVSGLHVHNNLQIISAIDNQRKGNSLREEFL